jgi:DNA-binding transcriptional LysR family regulator
MREGSMVRASSAMAITQPAISYLISGLENEVGFELFSRRGGKLTPTPEALQLMAEVNRLYEGLDGIKAAARQIANHERATVRVLITQALAVGRIVSAMGQFAAAHPGLKLDIDVDHRLTIMHRIGAAQADVGILSLPPEMEGAVATKLFDSELLCVASAPSVLHGRSRVSAADLSGVPVIAIKPGGVIRPLVEKWFADAGITPQFVIEVGDAGAAIELARGGLGVAIVTEVSLPEHQRSGLISLPLDPIQEFEIGAIVPVMQHPNRAAQALVEFLRLKVQD